MSKKWVETHTRGKNKVKLGVGYREGDIENFKGPQWHNLIIIQANLTVNKMKTKLPKI